MVDIRYLIIFYNNNLIELDKLRHSLEDFEHIMNDYGIYSINNKVINNELTYYFRYYGSCGANEFKIENIFNSINKLSNTYALELIVNDGYVNKYYRYDLTNSLLLNKYNVAIKDEYSSFDNNYVSEERLVDFLSTFMSKFNIHQILYELKESNVLSTTVRDKNIIINKYMNII